MQAVDADKNALLDQLRDIHAAADPGWWPPAVGWWVVAALVVLALFFAVRAVVRKLAALRRRRAWLQALAALDQTWNPEAQPHDYLAGMNRLFRAVALKAFPEAGCGRLQGEEWVAFVRARIPESPALHCLSALAHGPYEPLPHFDAAALREQARTWVQLYG